MSKAYTSNHQLVTALNHAHLNNGQVVIKLHGEFITGHIREISMQMREAHLTEFTITGVIDP